MRGWPARLQINTNCESYLLFHTDAKSVMIEEKTFKTHEFKVFNTHTQK